MMNSAPPRVTEAVVEFLVPPACREHIAGDLHERCTSPGQYLIEAICTVPFVIASCIRRTADPQMLTIEGSILYLSFLGAAWELEGTAFVDHRWGLLRLAIPTGTAVAALALANAYASPGKRSWVRLVLETASCIGFAFVSQAALSLTNRGLVVPLWVLTVGGGTSLLLVSALRIMFQPDGNRPRGAT